MANETLTGTARRMAEDFAVLHNVPVPAVTRLLADFGQHVVNECRREAERASEPGTVEHRRITERV